MKKLLPLVMILMTASAANAGGLVHKMSSSVQLTVDTARTTATRLGSQYSISGSNVSTTDGTTAGTISAGTITSGVMNPVILLQPKQQVEKHSPTVSLTCRVMQFQLLLLLWVLLATSVQLRVMPLELLATWQVLSQLTVELL